MNTEDRVTSLEGMISTLSKVATQQLARNRETDERLTMLLGIAAGQERDISQRWFVWTALSSVWTAFGSSGEPH